MDRLLYYTQNFHHLHQYSYQYLNDLCLYTN
nr:MAG TPA: hypothetical protein [Caudoviricetes sp.]